ncbi:MAG: putative toxin-antitoxin system toxin component, PIN family [bacterium]|nr:putative toxin-antitoxin system toxin component, PIN family [bacterium]
MSKVVFDSNIFISSIVYGGKPRKVFELVIEGKIELYISKEILEEVEDVLQRPKFKYPSQMIDLVITEIQNISKIVIPRKKINYIKDDPEDNMILECAVGSKADYIVTGDEHLLNIKKYKNIQILNAADFLGKIKL